MSKVVHLIHTRNFIGKFNAFAEEETKGLPPTAKIKAKVLMLHQVFMADIMNESKAKYFNNLKNKEN